MLLEMLNSSQQGMLLLNNTTATSNYSDGCPYYPYTLPSTVLLGFLTPCIIMLGLVANMLNFRIFTHKFMRQSLLNWYLAVLAMSDMLVLITGLLFICLPRIGEYFDNFGMVRFSSRITLFSYPVGLISQTASVWLTVLMSAHRFIGVCLPFKTAQICTKSNCRTALIGVLAFALLFNVTRFFEVSTDDCFSTTINQTLIVPKMTLMRQSPLYTLVYVVWCYFIVMFLLPFGLLISLNTAVILAIRRTSKMHNHIALVATANATPTCTRNADRAASVFRKRVEVSKEISTSIMLVGVVVVFLVCNTLAFVVNVLELIDTTYGEKIYTDMDLYHDMVDLSNALIMVNATSNIVVYLSFSEKYRLLFKHYFTLGCLNNSEPLVDWTNS